MVESISETVNAIARTLSRRDQQAGGSHEQVFVRGVEQAATLRGLLIEHIISENALSY
jgi:hypothetical protein